MATIFASVAPNSADKTLGNYRRFGSASPADQTDARILNGVQGSV
jgi:hypothetical protein